MSFLVPPIESRFVWQRAQPWLATEYWKIGLYLSTIYVAVVFLGQRWMRGKPAFSLRRPLTMWSSGLAVFSIVGCLTLAPTLLRNLLHNGFHHSVCNDWIHYHPQNAPAALWCLLLLLSKSVELGDTIFIVLRKTPLNFLHWYHHITVLVYSAFFSAHSPALSNWFSTTNYFVHSIMYSYYTLKAAGVRVPRGIAQIITTLQLAQFVLCLIATVDAHTQKRSGIDCDASYSFLYCGLAIYVSYFVLFLNFFCKKYMYVYA